MTKLNWRVTEEMRGKADRDEDLSFTVNRLSLNNTARFRALSVKEGDKRQPLSTSFHNTFEEAMQACEDFYSFYTKDDGNPDKTTSFKWEEFQVEWSQNDDYLYVVYKDCYDSDNQVFYAAEASHKLTGELEDLLGWDSLSHAKNACSNHNQRVA